MLVAQPKPSAHFDQVKSQQPSKSHHWWGSPHIFHFYTALSLATLNKVCRGRVTQLGMSRRHRSALAH
jgi:hypothetical protein